MRIVTSFGPARVHRQQKCLASWIAAGYSVIGIQSPGESESLQPSFPAAELIETPLVGDLFNRPKLVRVRALLDQAQTESVLILNSDIEIDLKFGDFQKFWASSEPNELKCGVRWDVHPKSRMRKLFKWGIDAFLITPQIAELLPDVGMTIGCPAWDYWIPWHLNKQGFKITTSKNASLLHELHDRAWSKHEYEAGLRIFSETYGVGQHELAVWVQKVTDRTRTQNWRPRL